MKHTQLTSVNKVHSAWVPEACTEAEVLYSSPRCTYSSLRMYQTHDLTSTEMCVLICQGFHNKVLPTGWLKQQNYFLSSRGWKSEIEVFTWGLSPCLLMVVSSLVLTRSSLCTCLCSDLLLLIRTSVGLSLTNMTSFYLFKGPISKFSYNWGTEH